MTSPELHLMSHEPEHLCEERHPCPLDAFALNGSSEAMHDQMLAQSFVLKQIALQGQFTVLYAKPNMGKTLITIKLLIDAIVEQNITPEDVYYINADDDYRGLQRKTQIAEVYKFHLLAPGFQGFEGSTLLSLLSNMSGSNIANGKVIILDTLKKFTDPMDKRESSKFCRICREFVSKGGTVIALSHANKNNDLNGKAVFGGTSDIVDDACCAYVINQIEVSKTRKVVQFTNIKLRGDVAREVTFQFSTTAKDYTDLLESLRLIDQDEAQIASEKHALEQRFVLNGSEIEAIIDCIKDGYTNKTVLVKEASHRAGLSKSKVINLLEKHSGKDYEKGHRWIENKGEKHSKIYSVLNP